MRLPVILVQNPPASGAALAEALVGNLIGRAGLDLTLVDRFESLSADSTDRMTLDGITVPSAVLDWRSETEILSSLATIEFHGIRSPHQLDSAPPTDAQAASKRRLFLFDLTKHRNAKKIIAELDRLRESLSVKTFSLDSIGVTSPRLSSQRPSSQPPATQPLPGSTDKDLAASQHPLASSHAAPAPGTVRSDENLDALIDHLDELDV